ncbi:hypothetical protein FJQ98_17685 [Lysinibacillus agricola]|uniref:Uncharacterized protein n=1 Tax=Lysinibacillus agricola TaxID=2590012 RepID=A0ABX7AMS3_9BACI|nr:MULTISPECIES: hypothetical protein [Lysinibacillus]KOS62150.1 hypothetical protein AN161_13780 [Lysinibacillus sp. FJAT-14222]QQP11061.1 hypothetical protein FJQ98_17685 [Lysinibacillus agricola]
MKITNLSQIQSNPVYSTNKNNHIKSDQSHLTEAGVYSQESVQTSELPCNYTPNEVGMKSNVNLVSFKGSRSLNTPNWDIIPTKGMKVPPQDVLISQLKALVEKSMRNTNRDAIEGFHYEKNKLHAQYISSVSPDRKTLHKQAMQAIKKFESEETTQIGEMTLVDYLIKHDNIQTETNKSLVAGGVLRPSINSLGGYDYDVVVGGIKVMESVNGQWSYGLTPAEKQKSDEFYQLYWSFVDEAENDLKI